MLIISGTNAPICCWGTIPIDILVDFFHNNYSRSCYFLHQSRVSYLCENPNDALQCISPSPKLQIMRLCPASLYGYNIPFLIPKYKIYYL